MADDTQQSGGLMGGIGKAISTVLPYALPAALGVAMGGVGGGIAAAGMAGEGIQEHKERQSELELKQQEIAMRWQEFGMEKQKAAAALQSEHNYQDWANEQPEANRKMLMALPPEQRGAMMASKLRDQEWSNSVASMDDPDFLKAHNLVPADVAVLKTLPAEAGSRLSAELLKAAAANNLQAKKAVDAQILQAQKDAAASGRVATTQSGEDARAAANRAAADARQARALAAKEDKGDKSAASMRMKVLTEYNKYLTHHPAPALTSVGLRAGALKKWQDQTADYLKGEGLPADEVEKVVRPDGEPATPVSPAVTDFMKKHGLG